MGQRVVCLAPFHAVLPKGTVTDSINPLDGLVDYSSEPESYLEQNPELLDEVGMIADALIVRPADEKDPHWNDKCRELLKGLILAVVYGVGPGGRRHRGAVRKISTMGREEPGRERGGREEDVRPVWVDAARGEAAEQDFGKATGELQPSRRDYWAGDSVGKGGGGTETEAGKTMAGT